MTTRKTVLARCLQVASAIMLLGAFGVTQASADQFQSTLDFGNPDLAAIGAGPYGTVTVTLSSATTALLTFTSASPMYLFTDGSSVAANGHFTLNTSSINGNCSSCTYSDGGSGTVDGVGTFAAIVDSGNSSPGARSSTISFSVTATGAVTWASADQVLQLNGKGYDAAAHIIAPSVSTTNTGFAGEDASGNGTIQGNVPEPTSIVLLSGVVLGLTKLIRKKAQS